MPSGTLHFALRCDSLETLEARRFALTSLGFLLGILFGLNPCPSYCFDDPSNRQRLAYTIELRQFKSNLDLFRRADTQGMPAVSRPAGPRPRA